MSWQGRRVLVTGAGGFIGSHLAERLVELGADTRGFVHYRADGSWGWLDRSPVRTEIEVVAGDICDPESLVRSMADREIVFHLAALIAIPYSYQATVSFVRTNVEGTLNMLQAARKAGVQRILHTSTSEVYGTARFVPIGEAHPIQAQSPYAATKVGADKLAEAFHLSFGLPVVTVRPFNTFGPRQSGRAIVPTIVSQCLSGTKIRLGNVEPTRDLNYVSNIVDGFLRAAVVPEAIGRTVNLGSRLEIKIRDLVDLIGKMMDRPLQIVTENVRVRPAASEVERLLADNTLAKELLDWKPAVSLEEGLRLTIEWIRKHPDCFRPGVYAV